jgi:hypothetical protein
MARSKDPFKYAQVWFSILAQARTGPKEIIVKRAGASERLSFYSFREGWRTESLRVHASNPERAEHYMNNYRVLENYLARVRPDGLALLHRTHDERNFELEVRGETTEEEFLNLELGGPAKEDSPGISVAPTELSDEYRDLFTRLGLMGAPQVGESGATETSGANLALPPSVSDALPDGTPLLEAVRASSE